MTIQHDTTRICTHGHYNIKGVELGGAIKNVSALSAGMCEGLDLGMNAMSSLVTRGCMEMSRSVSHCIVLVLLLSLVCSIVDYVMYSRLILYISVYAYALLLCVGWARCSVLIRRPSWAWQGWATHSGPVWGRSHGTGRLLILIELL